MSATFVVTDIEADGLSPIRNSMLSFASVAIDGAGQRVDEFEAVLAPRDDREPSARTMRFWRTQPEAYASATHDPEPSEVVMRRYAAWVKGLPAPRVFAARPLAFDGGWVDHYIDTHAGCRATIGADDDIPLFDGSGLDIPSFAEALDGLKHVSGANPAIPWEWLGDVPHTHRAIDDARGYANGLAHLLKMAAARTTEGALT